MRILVTGGCDHREHFIRYILQHYNAYVTNVDVLTYAVTSPILKRDETWRSYEFFKADYRHAT